MKLCLSSFSVPWGSGTAESPGDNKGKDIKAHKQHTHRRKSVHVCWLDVVWIRAFRNF